MIDTSENLIAIDLIHVKENHGTPEIKIKNTYISFSSGQLLCAYIYDDTIIISSRLPQITS